MHCCDLHHKVARRVGTTVGVDFRLFRLNIPSSKDMGLLVDKVVDLEGLSYHLL